MSSFSRTTVTNLRAEIQEVNLELVQSGSDYRYQYGSRNGYHAVDLMRVEADKKWYMVSCLDCAETPRVLIGKLNDGFAYYLGRKVGDKS
ncbi:MAG: hypothetical protein JKX78_03660 [Alteromonadaceae bacterium]|nr:hypothetical protein [Alteromonadaceae bacterium]MBL4909115.1 hypothetical protein [Alteromonadaceae bacterium]